MERFVEARDSLIRAIDGQTVLNEVIGPQREEINFAKGRADRR